MAQKKFDIVLTNAEWNKLRPSIKTLQKQNRLSYSAQSYAPGKVLIICDCMNEDTEKEVDKHIESLLGYVYA